MKRFLALFAVLVLCISLFAACKKPNTPDNDPTNPTIGEEEATLADAAAYLNSLYKDGAEATERDYDVVGKVMIGTTVFEVTWTVDVDSIKIVKSTKEGFWTVDLPTKADEEIPYTLTATIKDAAGNTETRTFKRKVPVMDNSLLVSDPQEGVAYKFFMKQASIGLTLFATGEMDGEKYLASTTDAKAAPDFFVEKSGNGVKIYTEVNGKKLYVNAYTVTGDDGKVSKYLTYAESTDSVWTYDAEVNAWCTTIGKTEYVLGTYSTYKTFCISEKSYISAANTGVSQFPAGFADKAAAEALDPNAGITIYKTPAEIVKAAYALEVGKVLSAGYQYTLTGVITKVNSAYDPGYGNVTVTIVVDGMTEYPIECYRLKGDGADKIKKGDTITVKGELLKYDNGTDEGKVEFNSGCVLVSYKATGAAEQKFENAVIKPVKPVAGKAYKVVYVQENLKSTAYFMTGAMMNKYYGETTTVEAEAADVYVETTTGGYYIYAKVGGEKVYVGTVKSDDGEHINFTLGGEKTVYTWNEDKMTMVATIDDVTYAFGGTYSTHSSISPQDISKNGFIAHFVVQGTTTGTTVEEEIPEAPEATDTFKEGVAYKMFVVVGSGKTYYALGTGDKFLDTTDKVKDAVDFYLEKSGAGFKIYYKNGSKKVYLDASTTTKDGKTSKFLSFKDSTNSVFTYDKSVGAWFTTVDGAKYGIGTYGSYTTISMSDASYYTPDKIGSQYVLQFVESAKAPTDDEGGEGGDNTEKPATLAEQIAAAEKLADNEALPYESTITGTITDDPVPSSRTEGQYKFTVSDGTNSIYCYYVPVTGGEPKKGDTITVTGKLSAFGGKAQFKEGNATAVLGGSTPPAGGDDDTPTYTTNEEILKAAYALELGATLGEYTMTGVITSVDDPYSTQYKNVTVTMVVDGLTNYPIVVFRVKGEGADVIKVGDTITVTGTIIKYDDTKYGGTGKVEFNSGCTLDSYVAGSTPPAGGDEGGEDTEKPATLAEQIAAAEKLANNELLPYESTITGTITDDPVPSSRTEGQYKFTVSDGTNTVTCYYVPVTGGEPKKGDTVTVTGKLSAFNGKAQFTEAASTAVLAGGSTGGDEGGEDTEKPATLAEQIAAAEKLANNELLPYESTITGTITDDPVPSSRTEGQYKFTVSDGTNTVTCYYVPVTGGEPKKGDTVTVTGKLSAFNGKAQFTEAASTAVLAGGSTGGDEGGEEDKPTTPEEIVNAAYGLATGEALEGTYTLTGVIISSNGYNATYGDITVTMVVGDMTDKPIMCYAMAGTGVDVIKVGDTITVTGTLKNYNGTIEFDKKCSLDSYVPGTTPDEGGDEGGEDVGGGETTGAQIVFDFGANGSGHNDGSDLGASKTYTVDGYSLALTLTKVYGPAYDAAGNSCIKLGTSSKTGALSFTVADDVTSVVIKVAKYKSNTTKISVNGTAYTLSKNSNDGEYDEITVDTSSVKTVNFETVSGGVRCMINEIVFVVGNGGNANPPADGGEGDEGGEDVEVPATLAEQLAAAAQLENDTYLPYESTITGVITNDPQASSYNAGQYRFEVSDGTNTVTCYYVPVTGGTPKKGDTVTVTGKLTAYNGSAQFDDTAAATWVSAAPDEGGDEGGEDVGGGEATGAQIVFDFGANGSGHNDGSDLGASKTYTVDGYSLALTLTKVYGPAYDAAGNSCI
ncbi:MAG: OB-fold nucleic acid binding domain-containing protein, partial [Clostridia bacterium]|nr:OB-fold nucleic acid binding domain-containing protein [Clostridia bacterium]